MFVPVPRISKEDLKQRLDGAEPPVVVDARLKYPYEHSTVRLPGAIRYAPDGQVPSLPRRLRVRTVRVTTINTTATPTEYSPP